MGFIQKCRCAAFLMAVLVPASGQDVPPGEEQENQQPSSGRLLTNEEIGQAFVPSPTDVPSPAEWFHAIKKEAKPRWRQLFRKSPGHAVADRHKAALALGAAVTDAFLAVEARGSQDVRNVLVEIRAFENTLGIAEKMQKRLHRIGEMADAEQWSALRVELEYSLREEEALLRQQRDIAHAELVKLGALVRAIDVTCGIATQLKLEDVSICLGDLTLVFNLIQKIESLPPRALKVRVVRDLRRCMKSIRDQWQGSLPEPTLDTVKGVQKTVGDFLDSLSQNE